MSYVNKVIDDLQLWHAKDFDLEAKIQIVSQFATIWNTQRNMFGALLCNTV